MARYPKQHKQWLAILILGALCVAMVPFYRNIPWIWLQIVWLIGIYMGLHELSHAMVASMLGIPIDSITLGGARHPRVLGIFWGMTVKMSWVPVGLRLSFGWAPLTRFLQVALGLSGALIPLLVWPLGNWMWHVILLTGLFSWMPGMPDARLVYPIRNRNWRLDVLRSDTHSYPIVRSTSSEKFVRLTLKPADELVLTRTAWVEHVGAHVRTQVAAEIIRVDIFEPAVWVRYCGQPYRLEQRSHPRYRITWRGLIEYGGMLLPCTSQDLSLFSARLLIAEPISTLCVCTVRLGIWGIIVNRRAHFIRQRQLQDGRWEVVAVWHRTWAGNLANVAK